MDLLETQFFIRTNANFTDLCTEVARLIPIYFMKWNSEKLLSQSQDCRGNWTNKPLSIQVRHRQIDHAAVTPHPSCSIVPIKYISFQFSGLCM